MSYGPEWRKHRRAVHRAYYETISLEAFKPLQELRVRDLLKRLLEDPDGWIDAATQCAYNVSFHLFFTFLT